MAKTYGHDEWLTSPITSLLRSDAGEGERTSEYLVFGSP
jgi:hypothetical protein